MFNLLTTSFELTWIRSHESKRIKSYLLLVNALRFIAAFCALILTFFIREFILISVLGAISSCVFYYIFSKVDSVSKLKKFGSSAVVVDLIILAVTLFSVDRVAFERGTYIMGVLIIVEGAALGRILGGILTAITVSAITVVWALTHPFEVNFDGSLFPILLRPIVLILVGIAIGFLSKILSDVTEDLAQRVAGSELVSKFAIESAKHDPDMAAEILSTIILEDFDFDRVTFFEEDPASGDIFRISSTHDLKRENISDLSYVKKILIPEVKKDTEGMFVRIPIRRGARKVGLLECYIKDFDKISSRDIRILENSSSELTQLIDQTRLWHLQRETISELESLNNLKDDFISVASHELRTPVTAMRGFLAILHKPEVSEQSKARAWEGIDRQAYRMQNFIEDILAVGMIDSHKSQPTILDVELVQLVKDVLHDVSIQTAKHILKFVVLDNKVSNSKEVEIDYKTLDKNNSKVMLETDKAFLVRILTNLIVNASRYSKEDSTITIKVVDNIEGVEVEVEDEGVGIPQDKIDKIFTKFQRLDETRQVAGSGLGLYIVDGLMGALGGEIKVRSEIGVGTTFCLYFQR